MRNFRASNQKITMRAETRIGKSQTVPDLAPSMREMLQRHAMGITDNISQNVFYSGDLPDIRGYEPHEMTAMLDTARSNVKALEEERNRQVVEERNNAYAKKRQRDLELLKDLQKQEE